MRLEDLVVVLKIAELKSITAAATALDMSPPKASMALKRVEEVLGVELFVRSTRNLRLSEAGERYLPTCGQALQQLEHAKLTLMNESNLVEGDLRVTVSSDLGRNFIAPWLGEFSKSYPAISIQIYLSDSVVDIYRDAIDIALRYVKKGTLDESSLYGFKICNVPHLLCAAPDYLSRNGVPYHPSELVSHQGILYQLYDVIYDTWTFSGAEKKYKVKMNSRFVGNDGDLVRRLCVDGHGLAIKSCLDVSNELLSGELVSVMTEYKPLATELWMVLPSRQLITPAVRLLRDMFKQRCQDRLQQLVVLGILDAKDIV